MNNDVIYINMRLDESLEHLRYIYIIESGSSHTNLLQKYISMPWCGTAVSPVHKEGKYRMFT